MLAGVGPVRLVLFVVAADEGWKPQSEEHLQILDVLGVARRRRRADEARPGRRRDASRSPPRRCASALAGTVLDGRADRAGLVARPARASTRCAAALDAMLAASRRRRTTRARGCSSTACSRSRAPAPSSTGTLTGGCLARRRRGRALPAGDRRGSASLQTHKQSDDRARAGVAGRRQPRRASSGSGSSAATCSAVPGAWRPTRVSTPRLRPVRGLDTRSPPAGAFKVYAGAAERDARIRLLRSGAPEPGTRGVRPHPDSRSAGARRRRPVRRPRGGPAGDRGGRRGARRRPAARRAGRAARPPRRPRARSRATSPRSSSRERARPGRPTSPRSPATRPSDIDASRRAGRWWVGTGLSTRWARALTAELRGVPPERTLWTRARPPGRPRHPRPRRSRSAGAPPTIPPGRRAARAPSSDVRPRRSRTAQPCGWPPTRRPWPAREEEAAGCVRAVADAEPTPPTVAGADLGAGSPAR